MLFQLLFQLPDLLIKPVQRLTKYELILKEIYKTTEKAGLTDETQILQEALSNMKVITEQVNCMMELNKLQNFDVSYILIIVMHVQYFY